MKEINQNNNNQNNNDNYYDNNNINNDNNYDNNKINDNLSNLNIDKISEKDTFTSPKKILLIIIIYIKIIL